MEGKKLVLKIREIEINIVYDFDGRIKSFCFLGEYSEGQWKWCIEHLPLVFGQHRNLKEKYKGIQIQVINEDLSFERFWNLYENKVGKKQTADSIWKSMSDKAKIEALRYIVKFKNIYKAKNWDLPLGDTYLRGRYWEAQK